MDYVNAVNSGRDRITLYRRGLGGKLETSQVRADYAVFLRPEDFERVDREIRTAGAVRSIKRDGNYWRVSFRDWNTRQLIAGPGGWLDMRGITQTFEGDVDPVRRFMIDTGATIQMPRAAAFDIETDSRVPFAKKETARILNWSLSDFAEKEDGVGQEYDVLDEDADEAEALLLIALFDALEKYDLVAAWNGDRFDFPVLKARLERLKNVLPRGWLRDALFAIDFRRLLWLDHMELFRKFNISASESGDEKQSVALQRVWEGVVGKSEGKLARRGVGALSHLTVGGKHAWEFWAAGGENRQLGARYNVRDGGMMREVEAETGYIAKHLDICRICGVFGESRGMRALRFVETYMMRLMKERGMRAPSKWHSDEAADHEQFRGAWVLPVEDTGILRDVHVFDFSGMYPSIMISLNMSPETRAPEHDVVLSNEQALPSPPPGIAISPITGKAFRTDIEGVFPIALKELRAERAKYEKIRDSAVPGSPEQVMAERSTTSIKNIVNSFYGATGSVHCRFFVVDVAESVTQTGVYLIRELTIPEAQRAGMTIVAADTDSGFARGVSEAEMRAFVKRCNDEVYPAFLKAVGARTNVVKLAYETELALMLSVARKKYAARAKHYKGNPVPVFDKEGNPTKPKIKGLEYMRGDWNQLARNLQKAVIDRLLYQGQPVPASYGLRAEDFRDLIEPVRDRIVSGALELQEFVVSKSIRKELDEYERKVKNDGTPGALPVQVEVAHWMAQNGYDVAEGTRVEYVVTDGDASPMQVVHVDAFAPGTEDRHYIWETLVWPPTGRLLQACFPDYRWDRYDESKPRKKGKGRSVVLPGQTSFEFLANDWGSGVPRGL